MVWFLAFAFAQWKTIGPQIGGWSPLPQIQWQVGAFMISLVAGGDPTLYNTMLLYTRMEYWALLFLGLDQSGKQWCGNIGIWACVPPRLGIWHTPDQRNRDTSSKSIIYDICKQRFYIFITFWCFNGFIKDIRFVKYSIWFWYFLFIKNSWKCQK